MLVISGGLGTATPPELGKALNALVCYAASTRLFRRGHGLRPELGRHHLRRFLLPAPVPRDILPEIVGPHL